MWAVKVKKMDRVRGENMLRTMVGWAGIALAASMPVYAASPQESSNAGSAQATQYRAVLNRYCVTCHNEKLKTANLMLDKVDLGNIPAGAEVWEKVIRKIQGKAMPPAGMPRPDQSFYESFPTYLETEIDRAAFAHPNPGRPGVHRLNRAEYAASIRELLNVDIDAAALLPPDDSDYGFDNVADVLSVSPTLLERYLSAARAVVRTAIGEPGIAPDVDVYQVIEDETQSDRMSSDLPLGSRGGMAIRHNFPADGEYVVKIKLTGVGPKRDLDVRLDDSRVKLVSFGSDEPRRGGRAGGGPPAPTPDLEVRFPAKAGSHIVGVDFRIDDTSLPEGAFHGTGSARGGRGGGGAQLESLAISGPYNAQGLGDTPSRQRIFVCHPADSEGTGATIKTAAYQPGKAAPATSDLACATKILSTLARRAYRRPVTAVDLKPLMGFYETGQRSGGFEAGIEMALERMLGGPEFLFRIERDPPNVAPGTAYRVSDLDLASRLSFFLWSSIPDEELLSLAERGKLKDPAVLQQQVERMFRDPRFSEAFVSNYFGQWLALRQVPGLKPAPREFKEFDGNLREAFAQETKLFLESMLREDHPLIDLLNADYTFLNERLARHYGIANVYGSDFRRVTLTDENRRGILGQGSLLTLTSYPTRTSAVLRGKWILDNILGTPPPPPPPNVPGLPERAADGNMLSVRQQMEKHRANPVCATCHSRMDPLGFGLENFDAVGEWRTTEGRDNTPIDSSGALPDGTKFQGPAELRRILVARKDQFTAAFVEKMLTYALGRGVQYYDEPVVRKIMRDSAPDYRWSALVSEIVKSEPFQMRRTREQ